MMIMMIGVFTVEINQYCRPCKTARQHGSRSIRDVIIGMVSRFLVRVNAILFRSPRHTYLQVAECWEPCVCCATFVNLIYAWLFLTDVAIYYTRPSRHLLPTCNISHPNNWPTRSLTMPSKSSTSLQLVAQSSLKEQRSRCDVSCNTKRPSKDSSCADIQYPPQLGILLPITSRGTTPGSILQRLTKLSASIGNALTSFSVGIDEGDAMLELPDVRTILTEVFRPHPVVLTVWTLVQLEQLPRFPLCWMWAQLAAVAVRQLQPSLLVLLGGCSSLQLCQLPEYGIHLNDIPKIRISMDLIGETDCYALVWHYVTHE